ncbi:MAG: FtsQ-type POTRA domain-containing protein [Oscillospiraceae bacterium]|nr:MAG: FtsQ-type POTRA domain-containing protein [Oscillospiraceae bacterium]
MPLKKRFRALRWLYGTGAALLAMLILSCTVLGVSYAWLVTDIRVEGASRYRADDLRAALGVRTNDLMLGFSASDTERSLRKQFPLLASASLHRALDGTLTLTVREEETLLYTRHYRNYYLLSATTLRVIAVDATPDAWLGYAPRVYRTAGAGAAARRRYADVCLPAVPRRAGVGQRSHLRGGNSHSRGGIRLRG